MRRSGKGYSDWAGSTAATCRSMCVLERQIPVRIRKYAAELIALSPDVMLVAGGSTTQLLLQETRTVPIIFTIVPDPVGSGFVESLSQPGGNASGFMQFEYSLSGKWLELLKQIAPNVTRAAILWDPAIPAGIGQFAVIQSVAPSLGVDVRPINASNAPRPNAPSLCSRASQMAV